MKFARAWVLGVAALAAAGGLGGCPTTDSTSPETPSVSVDVSSTALADQSVTLSARLTNFASTSGVQYQWFQTYGHIVALDDPTAAEPSFVTPSLAAENALGFRVDVWDASGKLFASQEATIVVAARTVTSGDSTGGTIGGSGTERKQKVRIVTTQGTIVVELDRSKAPLTVENFLQYVESGFYEGTIFHRVIPDFVVQGGGFTPDLTQKETRDPIVLESNNGLKNLRGTIAMARTNDPDSATSQFFFNLVDNTSLDRTDSNPGYAVFGVITQGIAVIDLIAEIPTETRNGMSDVPTEDVLIETVELVDERS